MNEEDRTNYPLPAWAKKQVIRDNRHGLIENICKAHGVGHPSREWMESEENKLEDGTMRDKGLHCCCGCCSDMQRN